MGKKFDKLNGKLPEFKGGKTKQTKVDSKAGPKQFPSEKMIKEGEKSAKKAKAAGKDLAGGGYKNGGKVKAKKGYKCGGGVKKK